MPDGWRTIRLGEVLDLDLRQQSVSASTKYEMAGVYSFGRGLFARDVLTGADTSYAKLNRLAAGQLVMSKLKGWEGALAVVPDDFDGMFLSPEFPTFSTRPELDARYLRLIVSRASFWTRLADESTGIGGRRERVHPDRLLGIAVDLPALVVQRRVVDLVDAVDTYVANAQVRAKAARAARNAVISDRLHEPSENGWERTTLGDAAEVTIGRQRSPKNATGEHMTAYLRAANVKDGYLDLDDVKEMNFSPKERSTYALRPGDVLVTEGCGSLAQLGACARWDGAAVEDPVCFQNTLIRLRSTDRTDPGFLALWAQWAFETGLFASIATGTNIFHLGVEQTRRLPLHLPPIQVQRELAALAAAFSCEIEDSVAAEKAARALRSALLGELLSGDRVIPDSYDDLVGLVA